MKTQLFRLVSLITGIFLFDFLFYNQEPGINALLFVLIILGLLKISGRDLNSTKQQLFSMFGLLVAGTAVALYNSDLSILVYFGSLVVFIGFSTQPALKQILNSVLISAANFFKAPFALIVELSDLMKIRKQLPTIWKAVRIALIPLGLLFVFTTIFRYANPIFNDLFLNLDKLFDRFMIWIEQFLSIGHLVFLCFAAAVITGILYRGKFHRLLHKESLHPDLIGRRAKRKRFSFEDKIRMTALKDEYRIGFLLLASLNFLLLIVNITEILWLRKEYSLSSAAAMSRNLHDGTNLLIMSIVLSIVVMMVLFRGNLNFYSKNKWLIMGAMAWIVQNILLGINVAMRNWFYISQYGLTYKRIGIYFFLAVVVTGLVLLYLKIREKRSAWYLLRTNSWSLYFFLILLGLINWDFLIIRYNLRPSAPEVNVQYLMDMRGRNLKQLMEVQPLLEKRNSNYSDSISVVLEERSIGFLVTQDRRSILSKNIFEWRTELFLRKKLEVNKALEKTGKPDKK
ncbi:MAG: DUF4173 domain-containing protein [Bacteroidales bacterium]|nr:DUF4173 domain-containing protein [Bacteroidales bacterium]